MKKLFILLAFLSAYNLFYAQDIKAKITYRATLDNTGYYNRLVKDTTITEFSRNANLENIRNTRPMNFMLYINKNEALYKAEFDLDEQLSLGLGYNRTGVIGQSDNVYYVNTQTGEKYYQSYFTQEVLVNMEKVDWTLTGETKKIEEYTCYKATAKIDSEQEHGMNFMSPVVAWYTPEIPTSFGIQAFHGLPGLIIELVTDYEKGKISYKAIDIDLESEDFIIEKPTAQRQISKEEYLEYLKKLNENRF